MTASAAQGRGLHRENITGVVLCGGDAERFDGGLKPLAHFRGQPLLAHVLQRLEPQVSRILLSAGRHSAAFAAFGRETVADSRSGAGPLGGLVSVLPAVQTPWLFLCPADAPRFPRNLVQRLAADAERCGVAVPHDGEGRQNLFLLLRMDQAEALGRFFRNGGRAIRRWLDAGDVRATDLSDQAGAFLNVNARSDLAQAR